MTTRRVIAAAAVLGAIAAVAVAVVTRPWQSSNASVVGSPSANAASSTNPFLTGRTLVIPHGGGDGLFPENTMLAYERTVAMGADVVDIDLRISLDGQVIAFHDSTIDRITGTSGKVNRLTYDQLSALDAGWAFSPDGDATHPFRATGVTIPTLASILDRFPATLFSLDLKDESSAMVQPVCDLLRTHHRFTDVFVGSNSDPQILEFRAACPDVQTSAIMQDVYASRDARAANDPDYVPTVKVDQPPFRNDGRQLVDAESLAWTHDHGVAILTWVVNDEADMRLLVGLGVDGIYTSYPDRLLRVIESCATSKC